MIVKVVPSATGPQARKDTEVHEKPWASGRRARTTRANWVTGGLWSPGDPSVSMPVGPAPSGAPAAPA